MSIRFTDKNKYKLNQMKTETNKISNFFFFLLKIYICVLSALILYNYNILYSYFSKYKF